MIVQRKAIEWLATGQTGLSSECMAFWLAFDCMPARRSHPHDPSDFDRCLGLLEAAPGLRDALPRMAEVSSAWAALVARWDEIEASLLDEVGRGWTKARSAPKTYALMKSVIGDADRAVKP